MTIETELLTFAAGAARTGRDERAPRPAAAAPPLDRPALELPSEETPPAVGTLYAALERRLAGGDGTQPREDLLGEDRPVVLGVSSAVPGEGKTTVALHLALTVARDTFQRVCLIDLSLGRGDLGARVGAPEDRGGLVAVLEGEDRTVPALRVAGYENLVIIPSGGRPANPARLARSPRLEHLLLSARQAFDVVVLDLPPVSSHHALPLTSHVDGLVVVVRAGVTPRDQVTRALDALGRQRVIGVTLNRAGHAAPTWLQRRLLRA